MQHDNPLTIAAAVALSCVGVMGLLAAPLLQNALQGGLGLAADQSALIVSAEIGSSAIASLLAAMWITRVNWKVAAAAAILVLAAVNVVSGYQTNFTTLITLRICAGLFCAGTAYAVAIGIIGNYTSNPDRNFGFAIAAQTALAVLSFFFLPSLIGDFGIKGLLIPLAVVALLFLPLILWVPTGIASDSEFAAQAADQKSSAAAIAALAILFVWVMGVGAIWTFIITIGNAGGLEIATAGRAIAISTAIAIGGGLSASFLAGRGARLAPLTVALVMQIIAIAMLWGKMSFLQFTAIAVLFQFFWNFTTPFLMGMVSANDHSGRISVLMPAAMTGGFAFGPAIAGAVMTDGNLIAANYFSAGGCALTLLLISTFILRQRSQQANA